MNHVQHILLQIILSNTKNAKVSDAPLLMLITMIVYYPSDPKYSPQTVSGQTAGVAKAVVTAELDHHDQPG